MRTRVHGVIVWLASGRTVEYGWATAVGVGRYWDLLIYQGRRQRVFHPAEEWLSYRALNGRRPAGDQFPPLGWLREPLALPPPPVHHDQTAEYPALGLERDWAPVPRSR